MQNGIVESLFLAPQQDAPVQQQTSLQVLAGQGIRGDRYFLSQAPLSGTPAANRKEDLTLIDAAQLEHFNEHFGLRIPHGDFRRNIITRGIDLNALVGKRFRVGTALCEGMELCEPCSKLARTVSRQVLPHLVHRAGLRAAIIESGDIEPGDTIETTNI